MYKIHKKNKPDFLTFRITVLAVSFLIISSTALTLLIQLNQSTELARASSTTETTTPTAQRTNPEPPQDESLVLPDIQYAPELTAIVEEFNTASSGSASILIASLSDPSQAASIRSDQTMISASLYKTLAAHIVLQEVDAGTYALDQKVTDDYTLKECIDRAISVSDNPCGIILQKLALQSSITPSQIGLHSTTLHGYLPTTTAFDQYTLYSAIYSGKYLTGDSRDVLLRALGDQKIRDRLPAELAGSDILHKTGDLNGAAHAVSILTSADGEQYFIAALTDDWEQPLASKYAMIANLHSSVSELGQ